MKCCLCGKDIEAKGAWTLGNNAQPLDKGRCCDQCNTEKVIPVRIELIRKHKR